MVLSGLGVDFPDQTALKEIVQVVVYELFK